MRLSRLGCGSLLGTTLILFAAWSSNAHSQEAAATTAWQGGHFHIDVPGWSAGQTLFWNGPTSTRRKRCRWATDGWGGCWSEDGYTAQLNREDTWPSRLSPGHVVLPGLKKLTGASDYSGRPGPVQRRICGTRRRHDRHNLRGHRPGRDGDCCIGRRRRADRNGGAAALGPDAAPPSALAMEWARWPRHGATPTRWARPARRSDRSAPSRSMRRTRRSLRTTR